MEPDIVWVVSAKIYNIVKDEYWRGVVGVYRTEEDAVTAIARYRPDVEDIEIQGFPFADR